MADPTVYECEKCGKKVASTAGASGVSPCCGAPVKAADLPVCTTAPSAEHARAADDDEPCDDGRAGKT